jgi:hypothetical protein
MEECGVGGADAGPIGYAYGNGSVGLLDVGVGAVAHEIVAGCASVGNDVGGGSVRGGSGDKSGGITCRAASF